MSLVDLESVKKISNNLEIKTTVSGGSVANSIVCLAQNKIKTAFIGKVGKDEMGDKFVEGLTKEQNYQRKHIINLIQWWRLEALIFLK